MSTDSSTPPTVDTPTLAPAYPLKRASTSEFLQVRGLRYHVRRWGTDDGSRPVIVMLHGWMDVSASFQFVVDAMAADWPILAPDFRGYGLTDHSGSDAYWFPDYLADLDVLLDQLLGKRPIILVGHSMGGNVTMLYAGVRAKRCVAVVNLEGFGLSGNTPDQAPTRYARWLDELKHHVKFRRYASVDDVAARLQQNNPRLRADRAKWLAPHWARQSADGQWDVQGDPAHRRINPMLYRLEEVMACWRAIQAPVLWIDGAQSELYLNANLNGETQRRRRHLAQVQSLVVDDAGHMLHHDQPEQVAAAIEQFLQRVLG